ncbi:amidohydrolase [Roseomonas sp. NAR14]|uniref:Amidohydrolase n=1 Tax=Roseomonas acroporae TaxID=2937791 RepID=A0A9X1Y4A3_9PROT|nr:amidohydrolase [Roseomonas acroporae]MCK8782872.1 amidohydrolase [Roseomonas acroporae]
MPATGRREVLTALGAAGMLPVAGPAAAQTAAAPPAAASAPPPAAASAAAARAVESVRDAILRLSREVWTNAELSLHEVKSAAIHLRELEAAGFRTVSRGTSGVPTAFVSEWSNGSGGPRLGYLPEYDALPGLGNAAEPRRTPGPTGAEVGHGCGHNMLGAGCTGGAIALRRMMEAEGTPGTIRVYGCAAEETEGAKVYMARDGLFADLDAALAWHPAPFAGAGIVRLNALDKVKVMFHGRTAHAGIDPWNGRSALKAAEMFGIGVQMMREHVEPSARMHYIYEQAGVAPNVIPDFAQVWIILRDLDRPKVEGLTAWVKQVAEGAATATQTRAEVLHFFGTHDLLPNEPLARLLHRHLAAVPIEWTPAEQEFAKACQREMKLREAGLAAQPLPFLHEISAGGSTDVGEVSYQAPVGVFAWPTMPLGVGLHTWPVTACGGMSIGDKGSLNTARILAAAGWELMTDAALREAAKADFAKRRGDRPFKPSLPASQLRPIGLPAFMTRTADDEMVTGID